MKTKGVHEKNTMSEGCRIASMEEYIILQDKIDKIGDFRFRVKGWTITIMIAVLFTGFTSSAPSWVILFAIPMIFLFQTMEGYQDLLSGAYSKRIFVLEKKLFKNFDAENNNTPAIGRSVSSAFWFVKRNGSIIQRTFVFMNSGFYPALYILIVILSLVKLFFVPDIAPIVFPDGQTILI